MRLIGITFGDPYSAGTYSGVPYHLFQELADRGHLVGRMDANLTRVSDLCRGVVDWRRTWAAKRPRRNAFWRYLPENIERLSQRMREPERDLPPHDAVLQFGVAGLADPHKLRIAHVEISIATAASSSVFSKTYGFAGRSDGIVAQAIEGERYFLGQCDLIWTNSAWTARGFQEEGVPTDRFWIHPPACNLADPGETSRSWDTPHVLFVGKVWTDKGGPLLLDAFHLLRKAFPQARLTIVGCRPEVAEPGVSVWGFLSKQNPAQAAILRAAFREATIFCMPSVWESVGLVYMEAALYGLPIVMLKGQCREEVFPTDMAVHLDSPSSQDLGDVLIGLASDAARMQIMGTMGRQRVLEQHTWPAFARKFMARLEALRNVPVHK